MARGLQGDLGSESILVPKQDGDVYSASYRNTEGMHQTLIEVCT
jgi:hypothetical protein